MALVVIAPSGCCLGLNETLFVTCLVFSGCSAGGSSFDYSPRISGRIEIRDWYGLKVLTPAQPDCLPELCHL